MIGKIIKEKRILREMTQIELAKGICSAKYVYLIEKDERNPSAYILNQFSDKLGIDLFEYYQYQEFENIILVVEFKKKFDKYIQSGEINKLRKEALKAAEIEDFKQEPLCYDLMIINLLHEGVIEGKTSKAIQKLRVIFEKKELNIDPLTLINGHIVLSTCYQLEGKLNQAKEVLDVAYDMIRNKKGFIRYHTVIINVFISLTSYFYNAGEYEQLKKYSKILLEFQEEHNLHNRIYYAYFYLSFAYYKTNQLVKAEDHFMKGLHSSLLFKNKMDINIISEMIDFNKMLDKLEINQYYIKQIYEFSD